jgi:hypothetical protein
VTRFAPLLPHAISRAAYRADSFHDLRLTGASACSYDANRWTQFGA